ncbi:hypothetical protein AVEN_225656-1 [Araneus ventricosus]|uniref:Uncharacterized protein n=1 Tax=Araneus ventricosus TaxID=182803 RepID=A0A4Y2TSP1_ARAVE|nr:hypothetical protein AVEN_225656-1 [Araneus ventricosus]
MNEGRNINPITSTYYRSVGTELDGKSRMASALEEVWPLHKVPGLDPGSKPDPTEDPTYMLRVKRFPIGVVGQLGEGALAQAPLSSSDRSSKLRGPSQNSPRVASKWHVNIAKLRHLLTRYCNGCIDWKGI